MRISDWSSDVCSSDLRWGSSVYVRPGIGIAIHDGPLYAVRKGRRVDLGSRVLFEPELAVGVQINPRLAAELSWVHMSHATLFSRSEEHTSELQSLMRISYAVFCLKKQTTNIPKNTSNTT